MKIKITLRKLVKKQQLSKQMFSTENEINNHKNKLEGIQNKRNEIDNFLKQF